MDHGHPLQLGLHVLTTATTATTAGRPTDAPRTAEAADLAAAAEDLGYDLVVVPEGRDDDPWTVAGFVAARTRSVQVATEGLDLRDRPPTVLARAASSLDHLSGGRLALGLAVVTTDDDADRRGGAAGAATPAEAPTTAEVADVEAEAAEQAEAVAEAIAVVRGMWDAADPMPLHLDGRHHQVLAAQRGPAPAHLVPLWLSGPEEAALPLAVRAADGWWVRARLGSTDLVAARDRLDIAARAAGRDPRELRLLITLDVAAVRDAGADAVPLLVAAVVDAGVGTIVLSDASGADAAWFAREVAPGLRDAVAAGRSDRGTVVGTVRSAAVRAARRRRIDYDAVPASLRDSAVEPGDPAYAEVRSTYMRGGRPGLVLRPSSTAEVVEALAYARTQDVPLAIRSGGHGISGRSTNDGGIVLDLGRLRQIEVLDTTIRRVRIGPGARWGEVAQALLPHGWAITSGDYGGVGVGGLATAGGIGFLVREHGLTLDHVRAVEMVLADGSVVRADAEHHPDLFWGVRGAGGNLGLVTSFEMEADEVGDVGFAQLVFDATDLADFLHRWGALVEAAPRDLTPFLIIGRPRGGQVVAQIMAVVDSDDPDTIIERLQPFATLGPLLQQLVQVVPYTAVVGLPDAAHAGEGEPVTRSAMLEHLTPEFAEAAARLIRSGETYFFQIRAAGGAVADVPEDATAYAHRSANFSVIAFGTSRRRLDPVWDAMAEHFTGIYSSFETDTRPERLAEIFGDRGLARLRALKQQYDPHDVFRHNHSVADRREVRIGTA